MSHRKFKIHTFINATIICCVLAFITLVGAVAVDEGTAGTGIFYFAALVLSKLFYVFRFPTHTLLFNLMNGSMFFIGLFINCILFGILTERLIAFFKNRHK